MVLARLFSFEGAPIVTATTKHRDLTSYTSAWSSPFVSPAYITSRNGHMSRTLSNDKANRLKSTRGSRTKDDNASLCICQLEGEHASGSRLGAASSFSHREFLIGLDGAAIFDPRKSHVL